MSGVKSIEVKLKLGTKRRRRAGYRLSISTVNVPSPNVTTTHTQLDVSNNILGTRALGYCSHYCSSPTCQTISSAPIAGFSSSPVNRTVAGAPHSAAIPRRPPASAQHHPPATLKPAGADVLRGRGPAPVTAAQFLAFSPPSSSAMASPVLVLEPCWPSCSSSCSPAASPRSWPWAHGIPLPVWAMAT